MLSADVTRYLSLRRALGYKLIKAERHLQAFARFASERGESHVRAATVLTWLPTAAKTPNAMAHRLTNLIGFARFLPIPMKPPHCSEMIAPPDSGMISPPVSSGSAGSNCCQFVRVMCQALRGRFRRRLSPLSSMRWALWTRRSRMASA